MLVLTRQDVTLDDEDLIHDTTAEIVRLGRCRYCGLRPCLCDSRPYLDDEDLYDDDSDCSYCPECDECYECVGCSCADEDD